MDFGMDLKEDHEFLTDPEILRILSTHPNSWDTRLIPKVDWRLLVQFYVSGRSDGELPSHLVDIIRKIRNLQLSRKPLSIPQNYLLKLPSAVGLSPKKAHEVTRMTSYIVRLVKENQLPVDRLRIVDVGAGQGYLTRALKYHLPQAHLLALDADEAQTAGARRWENRVLPNALPSIAHKTILITPENLVAAIDGWVDEQRLDNAVDPTPVIFVALHACGSLTLDVLRAYLSSRPGARDHAPTWVASAVVAVGCCYNLMYPNDFPLSKAQTLSTPLFRLPTSAFHLAAQIPSEWLTSVSPPVPIPSAALSVKKVVYRALIGNLLEKATLLDAQPSSTALSSNKSATVPARWTRRPESWVQQAKSVEPSASSEQGGLSGTGQTPTLLRLGKLNDRCYSTWMTFLQAVEHKLSIKFPEEVFDEEAKGSTHLELHDGHLERKLEVLHTLRCLLGPVIESAILRDRIQWLHEALGAEHEEGVPNKTTHAILVNLFDQFTGSGRNVAIVVAGQHPTFSN